MITGERYAGDDRELMQLQYEHYWDALRVLNSAVAEGYRNACEICGVAIADSGWPVDGGVDHRTIQDAHDILAAAWRHRVSPPEPAYDFDAPCLPVRSDLTGWLDWLRAEIRTWTVERPDLIALCVRILQNQNTDQGYGAEDRLRAYLRGRYDKIRWLRV